MPELPEVETFCQFLSQHLIDQKIIAVRIYYPNLIKKPLNHNLFTTKILNNTFQKIKRKGKYLLFFLKKFVLIVHLRMEGKFLITFKNEKCSQYCLLEIELDNQKVLHYLDFRKFGTFYLEKKINYVKNKGLAKLGLEPFDEKLTVNYLLQHWKKRSVSIKAALLEQTVIVGIGNIYASEILFASKIDPWKKVFELDIFELQKIIENSRKILKKAIQLKGSTISTFNVQNQKGLFFQELKVYARANQYCFVCNNFIFREKINGRSTFFCKICQKKS